MGGMLLFLFVSILLDRILPSSSGWPGIHCADQVGLEFQHCRNRDMSHYS